MSIKKRIHIFVNKLLMDTSASAVIIFGAGGMLSLMIGGVTIDLLSASNRESTLAARMNSVGSFASGQNSCTGKNGTSLDACITNLQSLSNTYSNQIDRDVRVTVTPGLWCTTSNGAASFVPNGQCLSGSANSAVKVDGRLDYITRFLKFYGKNNISKSISMTMVDSDITDIDGKNICPGIILNQHILSNSAGGIDWSEKTQSPRRLSKRVLRQGDDDNDNHNFEGETGLNYSTDQPFWLYDATNKMAEFPNRETTGSDSTKPIDSLRSPEGPVNVAAEQLVNVWPNIFRTTSSSFGKFVDDPDFGKNTPQSDNGGPQVLRTLKNFESTKLNPKSCMALIGKAVQNQKNKVQITGAIEITLDVVCDGKRMPAKNVGKGKNNNNDQDDDNTRWIALKSDGKTPEPLCSYSSGPSKVDISIAYRLGGGRNQDSDAYTPSDKAKWGAGNKGDSSKGSVKGMRSPPKKVQDIRSNA